MNNTKQTLVSADAYLDIFTTKYSTHKCENNKQNVDLQDANLSNKPKNLSLTLPQHFLQLGALLPSSDWNCLLYKTPLESSLEQVFESLTAEIKSHLRGLLSTVYLNLVSGMTAPRSVSFSAPSIILSFSHRPSCSNVLSSLVGPEPQLFTV